MFRALVVNPRETFTDVTSPAAWQLALSVGRIGYCTCQSNQSKNPWFVSLPSSSTFGGKPFNGASSKFGSSWHPLETPHGLCQDKYWRIESQYADGTMVDLNRVIPSFPILSRLSASQKLSP
jgi:hypothetical protein